MNSDKRGIQSVEVGGQLLLAFVADGGPMMLRDLARRAGMSAAKAHPYLVSFGRLGLVEQDRTTGRYELGPFALQLGLASMRRLDSVRIGAEAIARLASEIGQTVSLAVWGNHGPTIVRIEESTGAVHVNMRTGSVMSVLGTATGRVFAAFLPPKMVETFIEGGAGQASVGDESARRMSRKETEAILAEVRSRGLARAVGKPIPGVNAFSAPVFDHSGSIALAITAIGPSGAFDANWHSPIAKSMMASAAEISDRLGSSRTRPHRAA